MNLRPSKDKQDKSEPDIFRVCMPAITARQAAVLGIIIERLENGRTTRKEFDMACRYFGINGIWISDLPY